MLYDLVRQADVVWENFRPGIMERLGLPYAKLYSLNQRIIVCNISAYGQEGPYREWPAFDLALQAMGGAMSVTGEPGGRPVRMGLPMADLAGGLFGAFAVAGALFRRERTGEGGQIDLSLLDCQVSLLTYIAQYYWTNGRVPVPLGSGHASVVPYSALQTRDGNLIVAIFAEKFWGAFCRAVEHPEWERDLRFAWPDGLSADRTRELFRRHFTIAVHQHDQWPACLVLHHQRLDDGVLVLAELHGRGPRAAMLFIPVLVLGETHPVLSQMADGGRDRHGGTWR